MANKLHSLIAFLLLLAFQEMMIMRGEAITCEAKSSKFKGPCFYDTNCESTCKTEKFPGGKCHHMKCVCTKDCGLGSGTPAHGPPHDTSMDGPQMNEQPGEGPPMNDMQNEGGGPGEEEMPPAEQE
ncbi:hypothetical protein CASFOL_018777 [Castilleja foliolosa]|uniref:Knottins-like domain-containing protein n=1 Tax=Castilleja foliolosa TaxID=1961234 RepID=A0ABD3D8N2_9LAMI